MIGFLNKLAHLGIGMWVANGINDSRYRHGAYAVAGVFLAYQVVQAWRKGDSAYGELREFGMGMALPLAWRRWKEYERTKKAATKKAKPT